jgi:hypothetical protein
MLLVRDLRLQVISLLAPLSICLFLSACGAVSGGNSTGADPAPSFTSTPGTSATQGTAYTYQIQTSSTPNVTTLALMTAPSGATLTGNMLTWTPTAAQSRVSDQFSVTATNAAGNTTQSWIVMPAGTIAGSWVNTDWTSTGSVAVPVDWTKISSPPAALVPQPDGSFQTVEGNGNSDGTLSIPGVPGGYFWLEIGNSYYWTSSSTFDFGFDTNAEGPTSVTTSSSTTGMNFDLTGLDPLQPEDEAVFLWDLNPPFSLSFPAGAPAGATSFNANTTVTTNTDFSRSGTAFLMQYEPESFGAMSAFRLGPELTLPGLALVNGTSNTVNGALVPSPQNSFDLNVKGSAWMPLFNNVAPSSPTVEGSDLQITADAFMADGKLPFVGGMDIPLVADLQQSSPGSSGFLPQLICPVCTGSGPVESGNSTFLPGKPPVTTDQDFGTVQYGDPFPSVWPRVFKFCQTASVPIPLPGSSSSVSSQLVDTQSGSLPTSPIAPLIGQVQNPTINGQSFFVPASVAAMGVVLKWTAPSGTTPTGYKIATFIPGTLPIVGQAYLPSLSFYTAKTSMSLPPLPAGNTYVFIITAILDGAANFETSPNRSALPTASVSVISAPITISSGT